MKCFGVFQMISRLWQRVRKSVSKWESRISYVKSGEKWKRRRKIMSFGTWTVLGIGVFSWTSIPTREHRQQWVSECHTFAPIDPFLISASIRGVRLHLYYILLIRNVYSIETNGGTKGGRTEDTRVEEFCWCVDAVMQHMCLWCRHRRDVGIWSPDSDMCACVWHIWNWRSRTAKTVNQNSNSKQNGTKIKHIRICFDNFRRRSQFWRRQRSGQSNQLNKCHLCTRSRLRFARKFDTVSPTSDCCLFFISIQSINICEPFAESKNYSLVFSCTIFFRSRQSNQYYDSMRFRDLLENKNRNSVAQ